MKHYLQLISESLSYSSWNKLLEKMLSHSFMLMLILGGRVHKKSMEFRKWVGYHLIFIGKFSYFFLVKYSSFFGVKNLISNVQISFRKNKFLSKNILFVAKWRMEIFFKWIIVNIKRQTFKAGRPEKLCRCLRWCKRRWNQVGLLSIFSNIFHPLHPLLCFKVVGKISNIFWW